MQVFNSTTVPTDQVDSLTVLGYTKSNWRQRNITLYQHPTEQGRVISDGVNFASEVRVISDESKEEWATALAYASRGKIYVSE